MPWLVLIIPAGAGNGESRKNLSQDLEVRFTSIIARIWYSPTWIYPWVNTTSRKEMGPKCPHPPVPVCQTDILCCRDSQMRYEWG